MKSERRTNIEKFSADPTYVIPTQEDGYYYIQREQTLDGTVGKILKRIPAYNDLLIQFNRIQPYRTIADMKTVYAFNGTHYEEFTPIEIKAFAEDLFRPSPNETMRKEFNAKILANMVERRSFFTHGIEGKLNFKNGVLNLLDGKLYPHSPEYGFRHVLPYDYNRDALCPKFDWWIKDVMLGNMDLVDLLQEFMGYVVRGGEYKYHKALWLSGSGRNGKSTFLSVLKALIGNGNYSTLSIKQIINDKFSSADLDGKIANFSEETSPEELSDSGPFKNLTGDGELTGQKKYGDPYSFRNRAKLIMTYNEPPLMQDLSPGMLSRPIIIPWKKDLTRDEDQDKNLHEVLFSELSGIFNFALKGWERLDSQGKFSRCMESELEMQHVKEESCTAFRFIVETIKFKPIEEYSVPYKAADIYRLYCEHIGRYPISPAKFFRRLSAHPEMKKRQRHTKTGTEYFALSCSVFNQKQNSQIAFA